MRIHLTFDDGPDPRGTPAVLEALARVGATATFFVVGERALAHPRLVRAVAEAGHEVALHCHRHLPQESLGAPEVEADCRRALAAIARAGVGPVRWWRPPWGRPAAAAGAVAAGLGLRLVGWSVDPEDWREGDAAALLARLAPRAGDVILLHDGVGPRAQRPDCSATAAAVGPLVAAARAAGLEPAPLEPGATHVALLRVRSPAFAAAGG